MISNFRRPLEQQFGFFDSQENITFISNGDVRDIILNETLIALEASFVDFETVDYMQWFQVYLGPVIASLQPGSLSVIPRNISCASYEAM